MSNIAREVYCAPSASRLVSRRFPPLYGQSMTKPIRYLILAAVLLMAAGYVGLQLYKRQFNLPLTEAEAALALSAAEIRDLLPDKTLDYRVENYAYFSAEGLVVSFAKGVYNTGQWSVRNQQVCIKWFDSAKKCRHVLRDGESYRMRKGTGTSWGFKITPGDAYGIAGKKRTPTN